MPTSKTISARVAIRASQAETFKAVTDWESQNKWIFATKVWGVGDNSHSLGGKLEAFTGFWKLGFLDTMTITKWEPPTVCEVTHTGNVVKGRGLFEVTRESDTTYFTWTEYTEVPFGVIGRLCWVFVGPLTKLGLMMSLKRFSKLF